MSAVYLFYLWFSENLKLSGHAETVLAQRLDKFVLDDKRRRHDVNFTQIVFTHGE